MRRRDLVRGPCSHAARAGLPGRGLARNMLSAAWAVTGGTVLMLCASVVNGSSGHCSVIVAKLDFGEFPASKPYAESNGLIGVSCRDVSAATAARFELRLPKRVQVIRDETVVATIGTHGERTEDHDGEILAVVQASDIEQSARTTEVFFSVSAWIEVSSMFSGQLEYDLPFKIDF